MTEGSTYKANTYSDEYAEYTLQYGPMWGGPEANGDPIARAKTTLIEFFIKQKETDNEYILALTDEDDEKIEWMDVDDGVIRIHVSHWLTNLMSGIGLYWEVRVTFTNGKTNPVGKGKIDIVKTLENHIQGEDL